MARALSGPAEESRWNPPAMWNVIGLLVVSNVFMTFAWYGHLKDLKTAPLWVAVLASWGIALLEYCFQVPANRLGYSQHLPLAHLKGIQEIITLVVFLGFSVLYMREPLKWNYLVGFGLLIPAAFFIFKDFAK
jgi:uncharacterized protein (DUF486 family)